MSWGIFVIETLVQDVWEPVSHWEVYPTFEKAEARRKESYPDAPEHPRGPILYRTREYKRVEG